MVLKKKYVLEVFKTFIYILHGIGIFVVLEKGAMEGETDESQILGPWVLGCNGQERIKTGIL
jgi:hypothetical protein